MIMNEKLIFKLSVLETLKKEKNEISALHNEEFPLLISMLDAYRRDLGLIEWLKEMDLEKIKQISSHKDERNHLDKELYGVALYVYGLQEEKIEFDYDEAFEEIMFIKNNLVTCATLEALRRSDLVEFGFEKPELIKSWSLREPGILIESKLKFAFG